MKKLLSILLVMAMMFSMTVIPVSAADTLTITGSTATGNQGSTVTIPLSITNNPGIAGLTMSVAYNADVMTLDHTSLETYNGEALSGMMLYMGPASNEQNPAMFSWANLKDIDNNGILLNLTFTIHADAPAGEYTVDIEVDTVGNAAGHVLDYTVFDGIITVECSHTDTTVVPEQPATCKDVGYTAGVFCNSCQADAAASFPFAWLSSIPPRLLPWRRKAPAKSAVSFFFP